MTIVSSGPPSAVDESEWLHKEQDNGNKDSCSIDEQNNRFPHAHTSMPS